MSAILDLLTRRVEEKGISKMILDIKEEIETQEKIEAKFNELLRFYSFYTGLEPNPDQNDELEPIHRNIYQLEKLDDISSLTPLSGDATIYDKVCIYWKYILYHMEEDILRIPAILYKDLYKKSICHYGNEANQERIWKLIAENGVEKTIDFPDMLNCIMFSHFEIAYFNRDINEMRNIHGCIHV